MEGRLSPCQANAIDPITERDDTVQDALDGKGNVLLGGKNEGMVVAVKAAEVAVRKKEDGADFPRPVDKRGFQESFDLDHDSP
jgi:hypothetical protein